MALKDKPVDLEDLKALKDWIVGRIDMWDDITNSLTWNNASWVPYSNSGEGYKNTYETDALTGVKVAKLSVVGGQSFKVYSWQKSDGYAYGSTGGGTGMQWTVPAILEDANGKLISFSARDSHDGPSLLAGDYHRMGTAYYNEVDVAIPNSAKYMYIFDYAGHRNMGRTSGEVVVKRSI